MNKLFSFFVVPEFGVEALTELDHTILWCLSLSGLGYMIALSDATKLGDFLSLLTII